MTELVKSVKLLDAASANGASAAHQPISRLRTFQATGITSAGAGTATVTIQGSNVDSPATGTTDADWVDIATFDMTLSTTKTGGGAVSDAPWKHVRAVLASLTGTGAAVSVYMGCAR